MKVNQTKDCSATITKGWFKYKCSLKAIHVLQGIKHKDKTYNIEW